MGGGWWVMCDVHVCSSVSRNVNSGEGGEGGN